MEEIKLNNPEINKYFEALKEEDYDETFNSVEAWLRREHFFNSGKIQRTKSARIKYFLFAHRAKLAYAVLIVFVTLIVANVKVTSKETVAGVVSWSVDKNNKEAIEKIDNADWLDKNQLVVDEQNGADSNLIRYKFIIADNEKFDPDNIKLKLEEIKDIKSIQLVPITEDVNVPLYAAAIHSVFKSDIPNKFVNAEDIKKNVYEQLKFAGIDDEDCDVNYAPDARGVKVLIRIQQDSLKHKIHDDIMKSINTEKMLNNTEQILNNLKMQLNENLPKFKEEFGSYGKFNPEKLNEAMKRVQIKIDSLKINFDETEFEKSMESLHSLDTLGSFINKKIEESMRLNEENMKRNEENIQKNEEKIQKNEEKMKKFEERMREKEERMKEKEERLKSLDTLGKFINKQVEENLQKSMEHLKMLDTLGPFIQRQIKIEGHMNFDTAKFNRKMEKLRIKMDSLKFQWNGDKYDNEKDNDKDDKDIEKEEDNSNIE